MNTALWIITGLLTAIYLFSGFGKLFVPREKMAAMADAARWVLDFKPGTLKVIGALEILGAAGLILPAVLDIAPVMVPVTAVCWVALMVGAMITHGRLGQYKLVMLNSVYLVLAGFIAWGRFVLEPFTG